MRIALVLAEWVKSRSPVECWLEALPHAYRCFTSDGVDVAEAAILNGAGKAETGARALYKRRETEARAAARGMWKRR